MDYQDDFEDEISSEPRYESDNFESEPNDTPAPSKGHTSEGDGNYSNDFDADGEAYDSLDFESEAGGESDEELMKRYSSVLQIEDDKLEEPEKESGASLDAAENSYSSEQRMKDETPAVSHPSSDKQPSELAQVSSLSNSQGAHIPAEAPSQSETASSRGKVRPLAVEEDGSDGDGDGDDLSSHNVPIVPQQTAQPVARVSVLSPLDNSAYGSDADDTSLSMELVSPVAHNAPTSSHPHPSMEEGDTTGAADHTADLPSPGQDSSLPVQDGPVYSDAFDDDDFDDSRSESLGVQQAAAARPRSPSPRSLSGNSFVQDDNDPWEDEDVEAAPNPKQPQQDWEKEKEREKVKVPGLPLGKKVTLAPTDTERNKQVAAAGRKDNKNKNKNKNNSQKPPKAAVFSNRGRQHLETGITTGNATGGRKKKNKSGVVDAAQKRAIHQAYHQLWEEIATKIDRPSTVVEACLYGEGSRVSTPRAAPGYLSARSNSSVGSRLSMQSKHSKTVSKKTVKQQEVARRNAEREKGFNLSIPCSERVIRPYTALADWNCRFVENNKLRRHLKKTMPEDHCAGLLLEKRLQYRALSEGVVLPISSHGGGGGSEGRHGMEEMTGSQSPGEGCVTVVDWAQVDFFLMEEDLTAWSTQLLEAITTADLSVAFDEGISRLESLWRELHFPSAEVLRFRVQYFRQKNTVNYAHILGMISRLLIYRAIVLQLLHDVSGREVCLERLNGYLEVEDPSTVSEAQMSEVMDTLKEFTHNCLGGIRNYQESFSWNTVFLYHGMDYAEKIQEDLVDLRSLDIDPSLVENETLSGDSARSPSVNEMLHSPQFQEESKLAASNVLDDIHRESLQLEIQESSGILGEERRERDSLAAAVSSTLNPSLRHFPLRVSQLHGRR
jgi:hypothetical protein